MGLITENSTNSEIDHDEWKELNHGKKRKKHGELKKLQQKKMKSTTKHKTMKPTQIRMVFNGDVFKAETLYLNFNS